MTEISITPKGAAMSDVRRKGYDIGHEDAVAQYEEDLYDAQIEILRLLEGKGADITGMFDFLACRDYTMYARRTLYDYSEKEDKKAATEDLAFGCAIYTLANVLVTYPREEVDTVQLKDQLRDIEGLRDKEIGFIEYGVDQLIGGYQGVVAVDAAEFATL